MMKQPIDPKDIRTGDLIRGEARGLNIAWEFRADHDHYNKASDSKYFLLDRPAPVPPTANGIYLVDGEPWHLAEGVWRDFAGDELDYPEESLLGLEIEKLESVSQIANEVLDKVAKFAWADVFLPDIERLRKEYEDR